MNPAFTVTCNGKDLTANYANRLIQLTVTDEATEQSDSCFMEVSNHDGLLQIPQEGHVLHVALGYVGNLRNMGEYVIDTVNLDGPPDRVTLHGKAAAFTPVGGLKPFQSRKTRSWDHVTLGNIVRSCATEAGMIAAVSPEFDTRLIKHVDQTNESDMNLLTRLARDYQAIMKPTCGRLVFVKRGESKSVTGKPVGRVIIDKSDCSQWSASLGKRTKFSKVKARYYNAQKAEEVEVEASGDDGGGAEYEHPMPFADEESAQQGAKSILDQMQRGAESINIIFAGRPDVIAEGTCTLRGFHSRMNGTWLVKSVIHTFSKRGYNTTVQGETFRGTDAEKVVKKVEKEPALSQSSAFEE